MKENSGLAFNGQGGSGYSRNNSGKVEVNHHTGHLNDGRLVNKGRGPTKAGQTGKQAGPSTASGKDQKRNPGGTKEFPKRGKESFNYGRGPTKGNQQ